MAKSMAGVDARKGSVSVIGDNRYGMREAYDPAVEAATKEYYREGDKMTIKEVKNPRYQSIKTIKR